MPETVTVTPNTGYDTNGNPITAGDPVVLSPIAVAPGNTTYSYGQQGDLDAADFTVYLSLTDRAKIADDDQITVRGKTCTARVQVWESPKTGRGGVVVLARSVTGAS